MLRFASSGLEQIQQKHKDEHDGVGAVNHAAGADAWVVTSLQNVIRIRSHPSAQMSQQLLGKFLLSIISVADVKIS